MKINYGPYIIKTHELDQKLSVQVTSDLADVSMSEDAENPYGFPNGIFFKLTDTDTKPKAMGLKRYAFGDYTFILGINNTGELALFYSVRLNVGKKVIDGRDTLTLAFYKEPEAN